MDDYFSDRMDGSLYDALASEAGWVIAAEPADRLPRDATRFVHVGAYRTLSMAAQLGGDVTLVDGMLASASLAHTPNGDSRLLLSGAARTLYHVRPGDVVDWIHLPSGTAGAVVLGTPLDAVEAATFVRDLEGRSKMFVMDHGYGQRRLVIVDLHDGSSYVAATSTGTRGEVSLAAAAGGRVAVAVAHGSGALDIVTVSVVAGVLHEHASIQLDTLTDVDPRSVVTTAQGVSYFTTDGSAERPVSGVRWESFSPAADPTALIALEDALQ